VWQVAAVEATAITVESWTLFPESSIDQQPSHHIFVRSRPLSLHRVSRERAQ